MINIKSKNDGFYYSIYAKHLTENGRKIFKKKISPKGKGTDYSSIKKILRFSFKAIEEARSDSRSLLMAGYGRARARIGVPRLKDSNDIHANFLSKQSHNFIATLRSIIIHARVVNTVHSQKFRFLDRIFLLLPLTFTMTTVRGTKFSSNEISERVDRVRDSNDSIRERKNGRAIFRKEYIRRKVGDEFNSKNLFSGPRSSAGVSEEGNIFFNNQTLAE